MNSPLPSRKRFLITGMVQGVGFRPFVARLAVELGLAGFVTNSDRGVEFEAQGSGESFLSFQSRLKSDAPRMALILSLMWEEIEPVFGEEGFRILASRAAPGSSVVIPPDIATCPACEAELLNPSDRRHGYPFLNCTLCGPRYTIIEAVPYDRARTALKGFPLCAACAEEYGNPENRRFHAQPTACPSCGPSLSALDRYGKPLTGDPTALARDRLSNGGIVALLGLGGVHLACDAGNEEAVSRLRERKRRPGKPLAVMCAGLSEAKTLAVLDESAEKLLLSPEAPIVILDKRDTAPIAPSVAPGQSSLGLFLPYSPLHKLLFTGGGPRILVMTSGNRSDEPIISTAERALSELREVADIFLLHDRPIIHPVDDSVVRAHPTLGPVMARRARGYAPKPLPLPATVPPTLCLGGELMSTVTVTRGNLAFIGPHVGDLKNPETEDAFRRSAFHLLDILKVTPLLAVSDLHPDYRSTRFGMELREKGLKLVQVQHHEAHAAACMGENGFFGEEGLALVLDGVGFGTDNTIWGGEILAGRPGAFRRIGRLTPVPQPGGDAAAKEPWRMAASWLRRALGESWRESSLPALRHLSKTDRETLDRMMASGLNSPLTSSCGRLFDAAAAIVGFEGRMSYTAQAPMELEALASRASGCGPRLPDALIAVSEGMISLDPAPLLSGLAALTESGIDRGGAALSFHEALSESFAKALEIASETTGLRNVFCSGGCFQNTLLAEKTTARLEALGLSVYHHRHTPPNDGCISYGQAVWSAMQSS